MTRLESLEASSASDVVIQNRWIGLTTGTGITFSDVRITRAAKVNSFDQDHEGLETTQVGFVEAQILRRPQDWHAPSRSFERFRWYVHADVDSMDYFPSLVDTLMLKRETIFRIAKHHFNPEHVCHEPVAWVLATNLGEGLHACKTSVQSLPFVTMHVHVLANTCVPH